MITLKEVVYPGDSLINTFFMNTVFSQFVVPFKFMDYPYTQRDNNTPT